MGFSLAEIREFLDFYNPESDMKQLLLAKKKFEARLKAFELQKQDIDATMAELKTSLAEVNAHLEMRFVSTATAKSNPVVAAHAAFDDAP